MVGLFTAPGGKKGWLPPADHETVADGDITFHDVSFAYGDKQVLHQLNITIPQGKTTARVGAAAAARPPFSA